MSEKKDNDKIFTVAECIYTEEIDETTDELVKKCYQVVINAGRNENIKKDDKFVIYDLGKEIFDPMTGDSLGKLELVKGIGKVVHLQEKIAIIESIKYRKGKTRRVVYKQPVSATPISFFYPKSEDIIEDGEDQLLPFENPRILDFAKYTS